MKWAASAVFGDERGEPGGVDGMGWKNGASAVWNCSMASRI